MRKQRRIVSPFYQNLLPFEHKILQKDEKDGHLLIASNSDYTLPVAFRCVGITQSYLSMYPHYLDLSPSLLEEHLRLHHTEKIKLQLDLKNIVGFIPIRVTFYVSTPTLDMLYLSLP